MISVIQIYEDTVTDDAAKGSNGNIGFDRFNRYSWRASLKLLSWLVGSPKVEAPPLPPSNQFNRDLLSFFLTNYSAPAVGGFITRPANYFSFGNLFLLTAETDCDADEDEPVSVIKQPIELLSSDKYNTRISSWIEELKPTLQTPIAKLTDNGFEFYPADIGNVQLVYIREPAKAEIKVMVDPVYHDEVPNPATSIDYDFPEGLRNHLIWFIIQQFATNVKDRALVELNTLSKP